jgi:peptide/nickel transport system permease protein
MSRTAGSLRGYILVRIGLMVPMVWVLLTVVFLLMRVAPGDPISATLGGKLPPAELARRQHALGFDKPILTQYFEYLGQVVQLKFGKTITDGQSIGSIVVSNGGATLELTIAALLVAVVVGLPLGLIAGRYRETIADAVIRVFGILTYAAPVFFVGLLAQLLFAKNLDWLPASTQASAIVQAEAPVTTHILLLDLVIHGDWSSVGDVLLHLIMPAVTLGLLVAGVFIRLVRVNVGQALGGDYVEAARARGVSERRVVTRHAFKNALVPVVTVMGLQVALLLGGAVLTEETFNWPGLGSELLKYLNNRDYIGVQGIVTVFALVVVFVSFFIDIINAMIDPRVRY